MPFLKSAGLVATNTANRPPDRITPAPAHAQHLASSLPSASGGTRTTASPSTTSISPPAGPGRAAAHRRRPRPPARTAAPRPAHAGAPAGPGGATRTAAAAADRAAAPPPDHHTRPEALGHDPRLRLGAPPPSPERAGDHLEPPDLADLRVNPTVKSGHQTIPPHRIVTLADQAALGQVPLPQRLQPCPVSTPATRPRCPDSR